MLVKNGLATVRFTEVHCEDSFKYNAPHHFTVIKATSEGEPSNPLCTVDFQEGPVNEAGLNGVFNEDLICMILERLYNFQKSEFACRENAVAITKLEEALMWLRKRTLDREARGVLGTYNK